MGGEKLVSRSLAMRPGDRQQPEAASRIRVRCSCECICKPARVGRWESSLTKQRGQGGRRQLSHSVPRLRRKSQFALIQEPSPELVCLPNTSSLTWLLTVTELPNLLTSVTPRQWDHKQNKQANKKTPPAF